MLCRKDFVMRQHNMWLAPSSDELRDARGYSALLCCGGVGRG